MPDEKEKILITGCSGRLGSSILEKFSDEFRIIGLDIHPPEEVDMLEDYYYMDISTDDSVENVMEHIYETYGENFASVIHLAAYYSFSRQNWDLYKKITIDGTKRLLNSLKRFQIEQFIFSSTQLVYAPCALGKKINEHSPLKPEWEYPKSKVITEQEILKRHGDIPVCIMRIAGIYDDYCNSIPISQQIRRVYEDQFQKHFFPGNLKHGAPFLHMDDFIAALYNIVVKRNELPEELILLLGEPKTYSYDEIQRILGKIILGKEFTTYRIPKFAAKIAAWLQNHIPFYPKPFIKPWMIDISDDHYELDISYSKDIIGWEPQKNIKDTLPKMIEALKKDPEAWYKEHDLS
jgi:nucleoside-diphosphate-sugar epimerase